jgi:hypothetical protein
MIAQAYYAERLNAPATKVWRYLDWPNLELMIPSSFLAKVEYYERRPVLGATRRVWLADGRSIVERLEALPEHPGDMAFDYRIIDTADFPLAEYRGSVRLTAAGDAACSLRFACFFTPLGISVEEWQAIYSDMQKKQVAFIRAQVNG